MPLLIFFFLFILKLYGGFFCFAEELKFQEGKYFSSSLAVQKDSEVLDLWCKELKKAMVEFHWKLDPCLGIPWKVGGLSVSGRALVYADFESFGSLGSMDVKNTTLIFAMVHGDELTPLYLGLQLAKLMKTQAASIQKFRVVVAPLINPDGFFRQPRTRVNAHGVDLNRNFLTQDWEQRAQFFWKKKYKSDSRKNPGTHPNSEPETLFQEALMKKVAPQKILSIHSPLNFLDYDGPGTIRMRELPASYIQECIKLRKQMKASSGGFFPGSLGNFSGHLGIPTLTIELRSSDPAQADLYWKQVKRWIGSLIEFPMPSCPLKNKEVQ